MRLRYETVLKNSWHKASVGFWKSNHWSVVRITDFKKNEVLLFFPVPEKLILLRTFCWQKNQILPNTTLSTIKILHFQSTAFRLSVGVVGESPSGIRRHEEMNRHSGCLKWQHYCCKAFQFWFCQRPKFFAFYSSRRRLATPLTVYRFS